MMGRQLIIPSYLLVVALLPTTLVASLVLPAVSKSYFPPSVPLIELEFMVKRAPSVTFQSRRKAREQIARFKADPSSPKKLPFRQQDQLADSDLILNELGEVLREYNIVGWNGGGGYGFRQDLWIPFVGRVFFDSGKSTKRVNICFDPETLEDWKALSRDNIQQELANSLKKRFQECQEKYSPKAFKLSWTKQPKPPAGLCEVIYEIKEIGTPPPNGALEIDPEKERQQANVEKEWAKQEAENPKLELKCEMVVVPSDGKPHKLTPHAILGNAAWDALDKAWINTSSTSSRLKVSRDTVHMFCYYKTKKASSAARARRIIQKALVKKAAEYPDWFEVSFPTGDKTVSFLTMEPY